MMSGKKIIIICICIQFCITGLFSQVAPGKFFIQLRDKNNNPYSLSRPSEFLSQRAIQRRISQSIPLGTDDIPVTPMYVDSLKKLGFVILNTSKWFNAVVAQSFDTLLIDTLDKYSFVKTVELFPGWKTNKSIPGSGGKGKNSISGTLGSFNYGAGSNQIEMLKGEVLHNSGYKGQGIMIAILDAGFNRVDSLPTFDSLITNHQIIATRDFVRGGNQVYDQASHGMFVLSIIGGNFPGRLVGTAPKADFVLIRTEDSGSEYRIEEDNWVSGAEYADSIGADLISSSLGYTTFDIWQQNYTYQQMNGRTARASIASTIAARKGMIVINSAGNEGSHWWHYIGTPADADSILTVGAVDSLNIYANFSSTGPSSDKRIKPDVVARGIACAIQGTDGTISTGQGTSFATPILAGLVACLWQSNSGLKNMTIIDAVRKSADQYNHPDSLKGYGLPDFSYANSILHGTDTLDFSGRGFLKVYPIPFRDNFDLTFYSVENQEIKVCLYNILGEKIFDKTVKCSAFSVNTMKVEGFKGRASGVNILKVFTNTRTYEKKLLRD